jgi:leucyl/phenylalanyl-tRNA--protein transferase
MSSGRVVWLTAADAPETFPPVDDALREPDGLLAAGGDLSTARILAAYRQGIFPWYDDGQPLLWWSPDPRCVFRPGDLHISRRLRRELRRSSCELRINTAFGDVIRACAGPRRHGQGTWITNDMRGAFERLHAEGWSHSIEVWEGDKLVGGLYGLVIGRVLFGESMFSRQSNASKMALLLVDRLLASGTLGILDCQVQSGHLLSLGAVTIPRAEFVERIKELCDPPDPFAGWPSTPLRVSELAS